MFSFYEPVWYLDPTTSFPDSKEKSCFVGFAKNVGDILTFKVLTEDRKILHWSIIRSANDSKTQNKRESFGNEIQQNLEQDLDSEEHIQTMFEHEVQNAQKDHADTVTDYTFPLEQGPRRYQTQTVLQ